MRLVGLIGLWILIHPSPVWAEEHGTDTSPTPLDRQRADGLSPLDVELLKKRLLENAGTTRWWKDLHDYLGAVEPEAAEAFEKELPAGKARDLLGPAADNFFSTDTNAIREKARNDALPNQQQAALKDIERRLKDPNTILISTAFGLRGELAMGFAAELLATEDDPEAAAKILARLMGTLTSAQREKLRELASSQKGKDNGIDATLLDRLERAAALAQGAEVDSDFDQAFVDAYEKVLNRNRQFHQDLSQALGGDKAAAERLKKDFGGEALMDFVSSQLKEGNDGLAVDIVDAMTRNDDDGVRKLSLSPSSSAADRGEDITLLLGDAEGKEIREQIRASLEALESAANFSHGDGSPLNGFTPSQTASGRQFAPVLDEEGNLTLAETNGETPQFPSRPVQRKRPTVAAPTAAQNTPPPQEEEPPEEEDPPPEEQVSEESEPKALTDDEASSLLTRKCGQCHIAPRALGNFTFEPAKVRRSPSTARKILQSMDRPPGDGPMPYDDNGFRDTPEGQALKTWLQTKS